MNMFSEPQQEVEPEYLKNIQDNSKDPGKAPPAELLGLGADTIDLKAARLDPMAELVRKWRIKIDTDSTKLSDRIQETKDAMDKMQSTALATNIGFTRMPRTEVEKGKKSNPAKVDFESGPSSNKAILEKATALINADQSAAQYKHANEIMEYVSIITTFQFVRERNVEMPRVLREIEQVREDKMAEKAALEAEGKATDDIDADIEELTNDVKRYKLTIATMWDLNPPQIVPVNEAEDSKGKKKAD